MQRESMTVKIHPAFKRYAEAQAKSLNRSLGFVIEHAIRSVAGSAIDPKIQPGCKMDGDEVVPSAEAEVENRLDDFVKRALGGGE